MDLQKFILGADKRLVPEPDLVKWADWMVQNAGIAVTMQGRTRIVTKFFDQDSRTRAEDGAEPQYFWTEVYGGRMDRERTFYSSYDDAILGHRAMVKRVKESR